MKSEKFTLTKALRLSRLNTMSICTAFLLMMISYQSIGQSCPLACNNLVQVSMDEDCIVEITPDVMLEGQGVPGNCNYVVQVLGINGQPLPPPVGYLGNNWVTSANIGQTLTVRVWLGANSCWGSIKIEDKLAPIIDCPLPITISCYDPRTFAAPIATDNCNGVVPVTLLSDVTTELPCTDSIRAIRTITYQAKDASNNVSAICSRLIYYRRITLDSIRFPKNYDGTPGNRPHLECDGGWAWNPYKTVPNVPFGNDWDTNNNNYPDPAETGGPFVSSPNNIRGYINGYQVGTPIPSGATLPGCTAGNLLGYDVATGQYQLTCDNASGVQNYRIDTIFTHFEGNNSLCRINTTFSDEKINICANSYKLLRLWTVLDWCTSQIRTRYQIIKVVDDEGPVVTCPADMTSSIAPVLVADILSADPYTCTASWNVRPPVTISDCNTTTFTVKIKKADATGNDPGPNTPFVLQDGETRVTGSYPNFVIVGLPLGRTWVQYNVTDACGNSTLCQTEVDVFDTTPPVAVCDEFTAVTLSNNGTARIFAESFDDGSHDNCTSVKFDVRRMTPGCSQSTTVFGPYVQLCCDDVGRVVMVELRVTDEFGNSNTCMVEVETQDKVPPVITCPANVTINCGADTSATVLGRPVFSATPLSTPYYTDNCPNPTLTWTNSGAIDNCGQGVITRRFTVTDRGGRTASCTQTITIRNTTPYTGPRPAPQGWPANVELMGCIAVDTDPSKTGVPVLDATACSQVAYTYEDQVFPFVENVCFKILRKWTVIDWCKFAPNRDPQGVLYPSVPTLNVNMWQYTQIIKITDDVKPVIQTCSKGPTDAFGENCNGFVELTNSATDCTPANLLKWSYVIDLGNDGIGPFTNGTTNNASGTYPVGTHKITWTVEDQCGNQSTCMYTFEVRDRKKPTPYCLSDVTTVIMPTTGSVTIWANDFDLGSFDNCPGTLRFSFSTNINETSRTYTCSQLGINTVNMYVWDAAGNFDFCTVSINIQANGSACSGSRLAGNVGTEENKMVKDVSVVLQNMNINETTNFMTNNEGHFEFSGMPESSAYRITPEKDIDHLNGVSTLDLVMIQRHILDIQKFNSPYKYLAGDVNKDNKISSSDILELRKLILGINSKFTSNTSWRFFNKSEVINDITYPWNTQEFIYISNFNTSMMQNNFVAVKIGDINNSATTSEVNSTTESRSAQSVVFVTPNQKFANGEYVNLPVTAENFDKIVGTQFTLAFDSESLQFEGIQSGALVINEENINHLSNGKLALSWHDIVGKSFSNDEVLFTIQCRATANNNLINTLKLTSDITKAEAYTHDLSNVNVSLEVRSLGKESEFVLDQNNPNPFTNMTTISFTLPQAGVAKLVIYDVTGKVVKSITNHYPKGRSEVNITADDIQAQGVLLYELSSNGQKATKKMIYLNK